MSCALIVAIREMCATTHHMRSIRPQAETSSDKRGPASPTVHVVTRQGPDVKGKGHSVASVVIVALSATLKRNCRFRRPQKRLSRDGEFVRRMQSIQTVAALDFVLVTGFSLKAFRSLSSLASDFRRN